ncbi:hypothetical protein S83_066426, partial [Arachis hypogaea]
VKTNYSSPFKCSNASITDVAAVSSFVDADLLSKPAPRVFTCNSSSISQLNLHNNAMLNHSCSKILECHYTSISNCPKQFRYLLCMSSLCDCDKLCQLLEQHLKLMQMLQ